MTVKNFRHAYVERIQYITPDGVTVTLHDPPSKSVLSIEGDGLPTPEYDTTRGPYQHGFNVLGMRVPQRDMDLVLRWNACSRDEYWTMRHEFINMLRPNRTDINNPEPGILRRILSNGELFDLDCYLVKGPQWNYPRNWDHWSFQETLKFTAFNPILYNPTDYTSSLVDFSTTRGPDITFPVLFDFIFGESTPVVTKSLSLTYGGNWESFPTIFLTGPWSGIIIQHQTTKEMIELSGYNSPPNEVTSINLTYGQKTILTGSGLSLLGYVTSSSDLSQFSIRPEPEVAGGINTFDVSVFGGDSNSSIVLLYKNRYIGI